MAKATADSIKAKGNISRTGDLISMNFDLKKNPAGTIRLNGYISSVSPLTFRGEAITADGTSGKWSASFREAFNDQLKKETIKPVVAAGSVIYPFMAFGYSEY